MKTLHSSYNRLSHRIVWSPKYRHQTLKNAIAVELKRILAETCAYCGWKLHELDIKPDRVSMVVQADHSVAPVEIAEKLKSTSAVHILNKFPGLVGRNFWASGLWAQGTHCTKVTYPKKDLTSPP